MAQLEANAPSTEQRKSAAPRESLARRLRAALASALADELLLITSLIGLCVLVKVLRVTHVDVYWDAAAKWHFVRQWSYANDFSDQPWDHHMARFGVNVPAYFVQLLLGTASRVYYVLPIAMYTLHMVFVYLLGRRLAGRGAGLIGALIMIFFTGMTRSASQLLPDGMVGTVAVIAGYLFVRFHEAEGRRRLYWLGGVALACVWAYAIKESSVLVFPGVALAVLLSRRSFKECAILCGSIGLYGALESLAFSIFTNYPHRLAIVRQGHEPYPPITFWQLFDRFSVLDSRWQMLFWLWVAAVLYELGSSDRRRRLLLLIPVGYVLLLTFMVRSINPIQQWLSAKPRYLEPASGYFALGVGLFFHDVMARAWGAWSPKPRFEALRAWLPDRPGAAVSVLCFSVGLGTFLDARPRLGSNPLVTIKRDASILNDAFRRNLPIVEDAGKPRGLYTAYGVYMAPKYLAQSAAAEAGILPNIKQGVMRSGPKKKWAYILRDPQAYRRGEMDRLAARGCAVVVKSRGGVRLNVSENLPKRCKAPRGEPLPKI